MSAAVHLSDSVTRAFADDEALSEHVTYHVLVELVDLSSGKVSATGMDVEAGLGHMLGNAFAPCTAFAPASTPAARDEPASSNKFDAGTASSSSCGSSVSHSIPVGGVAVTAITVSVAGDSAFDSVSVATVDASLVSASTFAALGSDIGDLKDNCSSSTGGSSESRVAARSASIGDIGASMSSSRGRANSITDDASIA